MIISFIANMVLARLLSPEDFGCVGIILVFVSFADVLVDGGLGNALIQKKDMEEADCCSVFYINIVMSLVLYGILYIASPYIADCYETRYVQ